MYTFQKPAHVLRVYTRGDAMSQVGDPCLASPAVALKRLAHVLHLAFNRIFATIQNPRVSVSLQGDCPRRRGVDNASSFQRLNDPVKSKNIITGMLGLRSERRVCPFRKEYHWYCRDTEPAELGADVGRNMSENWERERGEVVRREFPRP